MGDDRRQDDMAAQAWPGFVDILSSTVIMFVFFVMVVVVVLYLYTIKFTATIEQQAEQKIRESLSKIESPEILEDMNKAKADKLEEIAELEEEKRKLSREIETFQGIVEQVSVGFAKSVKQDVITEDQVLTLFFEEGATTLTKESMERIALFLENNINYSALSIQAGDNPTAGTQTSARQLSLARILNVRNAALKAEYKAEDIELGYTRPEAINENYNWVKITLKHQDK